MRTPAETLEIMLRRVAASNVICLDVETSGLDFKRNHIVGYVLTFSPHPDDSYYLPVKHFGSRNLGGLKGPSAPTSWDGSMHDGERALIRALDDQRLYLFGHNFGFDLRFMTRCGYRLQARCECTQVNAAMLDEYQDSFSLESCAAIAKVQAKKSDMLYAYLVQKFGLDAKQAKKPMEHFWRLAGDDPMAHEYAEGDGTTTWQLRDWQLPKIEADGLAKVHGVECRLIRVLARMSALGVKIDVERLEQLRGQIKKRIEELQGGFPSGFNPRGPAHVRKWMEDAGATDWPMTEPSKRFPNGQPSFPEEWLVRTEAGRKIIKARHFLTLQSTFVEPLATEHIFKGRVHTTFNQLKSDEYGATTGRLSSNGPNMQAIPKRDKEIGKLYRAVFIPDSGLIWFSSDYSQLEPRIMAYYSRCRALLNGYNQTPPLDTHTAVTLAAGFKHADGTMDRDMGKRCNMMIINGGGAGGMARKFAMELKHAYTVLDQYFAGLPEIRDLQKKSAYLYGKRGYIITLLGRKIRLRKAQHNYMALNRILQGGNADVIKLKMVEVDAYLESEGRPLDMLLNIHDSIDGQLHPDNEPHLAKIVEIMEDFRPGKLISMDIPIKVNFNLGKNWGDATWEEE